MPYNNAPIEPPSEITGTSSLPLARVKKIIAMDEDIAQCSNSAAFVISVATEIFIRYLTEQAHNVVKSERKPRRNIQYKDFANAVARIDNLEFLADVIPKTTTYKQFKEKKAREAAEAEAGQTTLHNGVNGGSKDHSGEPFEHMQASASNGISDAIAPLSSRPMNGSPIADRTVISSQHSHPGGEDVDMVG